LGTVVYAEQTPTGNVVAKKYDISFPVAQLGNCKNISVCRQFCEDPVNLPNCVNYAKQKGFYKEEPTQQESKLTIILSDAKKTLGCDSLDSCQQVCSQEANIERCDSFAKSHSLNGGKGSDSKNDDILTVAKQVLSCDSQDACKNICIKPENQQKCSDFARQVGLRGGEMKKGPGGCTTEDSCQTFCTSPDNFSICQGYAKTNRLNFSGPGGCTTEDSCKTFCLQNPSICKTIQSSINGVPLPSRSPIQVCNQTPNCSWESTGCLCGGTVYQVKNDFCKDHPEACAQGGIPTSFPTNFPGQGQSPQIMCGRTTNCYWTGTSCQCASPTTSLPTATKAPTPTTTPSGGTGGIPANVTLSGSDGTWCYDPLGQNADGNTRMHTYYTCKDNSGDHSSYCNGNIASSPYCTGTWNGSAWSNVRCATSGGYTCSGSWGNTCSDGVCTFSSTTPTNTPAPSQSVPTPTPGNVGIGGSVKGISTPTLIQKLWNILSH